jgi:hypothetical protein
MRYLMNAAVIPHGCPGTYTYRLATVADLIAFIAEGSVISALAYQDSLDWIATLTGVTFTANRDVYPLQPGDEAFVIRRASRNPKLWKPHKPFAPDLVELGLLRCEVPPPVTPTLGRGETRPGSRQARARRKA